MMVSMSDQPELSVVVPVFNEEVNIQPMFDRLVAALDEHVNGLEVLYVDDGSADSSWDKINDLASRDERARGIRFARNFGHQAALTAGVDGARVGRKDCYSMRLIREQRRCTWNTGRSPL